MKTTSQLASILGLLLAACAGGDHPVNAPDNAQAAATDPNTPATSAASVPPATAVTPVQTPTAAAPTETATPQPAEKSTALTDEQIIQVVHSANLAEIDQGALAQIKAKDARVKKLATMMVKDHTAADAKGMELAKKANLNPTASPVSSSLESDAGGNTSTLKSQTGADFDRVYVDIQVKEHRAVLDAIDQKLAPAVKNPDLKAFLGDVRPKIAAHLQHAEDLQKALQK
jgi:putative membrane protein